MVLLLTSVLYLEYWPRGQWFSTCIPIYKCASVTLVCLPSSCLLQCYIISASLHGLCVYTNKCGVRRKSCINVNCHSACTLCECPEKCQRERDTHTVGAFFYILLLIRLWVTVAADEAEQYSPQPHLPAPSGESWGIPMPDGLCNPTSMVWVCYVPRLSQHREAPWSVACSPTLYKLHRLSPRTRHTVEVLVSSVMMLLVTAQCLWP